MAVGIYTLMAGILLYATVLRTFPHSRLSVLAASSIVVLGYFALTTAIEWIVLAAYDTSLWHLIAVDRIATVVAQMVVAVLAFRKIENSEDSYSIWLFWGITGLIGIFFIAPYVATSIAMQL